MRLVFAVFYYWLLIEYHWRQAVCLTDFSLNQLLPENNYYLFLFCGGDFRSCARQRNRSCFTDVHFWTWSDANMGCKMNVCLFCSFITQIGFFCNSWDFFNCKCNSFKVKLNYKHRELKFWNWGLAVSKSQIYHSIPLRSRSIPLMSQWLDLFLICFSQSRPVIFQGHKSYPHQQNLPRDLWVDTVFYPYIAAWTASRWGQHSWYHDLLF